MAGGSSMTTIIQWLSITGFVVGVGASLILFKKRYPWQDWTVLSIFGYACVGMTGHAFSAVLAFGVWLDVTEKALALLLFDIALAHLALRFYRNHNPTAADLDG